MRAWAAKQLEEASARQCRYYNQGRSKVAYEVGDVVLKRQRVLSSGIDKRYGKLVTLFHGPFTISKVLSPTVVQLRSEGGVIPGYLHVSDIKPYVTPTSPTANLDEPKSPSIEPETHSNRFTDTREKRDGARRGCADPRRGRKPRRMGDGQHGQHGHGQNEPEPSDAPRANQRSTAATNGRRRAASGGRHHPYQPVGEDAPPEDSPTTLGEPPHDPSRDPKRGRGRPR